MVSGNLAQNGGDGGGIATQGALMVSESAIMDNQAEGDGGGISAGREEGYVSLTNVTILDHRKSADLERYAREFYELRRARGVTMEEAADIGIKPAKLDMHQVHCQLPRQRDFGLPAVRLKQRLEPDATAAPGFAVSMRGPRPPVPIRSALSPPAT